MPGTDLGPKIKTADALGENTAKIDFIRCVEKLCQPLVFHGQDMYMPYTMHEQPRHMQAQQGGRTCAGRAAPKELSGLQAAKMVIFSVPGLPPSYSTYPNT